MWTAILALATVVFQVVATVVSHIFDTETERKKNGAVAINAMSDASKKGDYDAVFDNLATLHGLYHS